MPANYDVITFDCYGTLIDWERGIGDAFAAAARKAGVTYDPQSLIDAYHMIEPIVEGETYRSYRDVLIETARRITAQLAWSLDAATATFLPDSLPSWPVFPDTNAALERLAAAGYRLGILSNVDDELLSATMRQFTAPIDLIVTAQQVRSYKPAHGHFLTARERLGGLRWLHAAQSYMHDVVPTTELGVPVVWVNRKHEPLPEGGRAPLAEVATMAALADWAGA
jgi:2-haloalkanoic acid dehalogenase type II